LAPHADAGFWIAISRRVTVHVLSSVGGAFPRPLVLFGDREAATWGRPFWLGQSSLAVALN
jgi:hypothetical protein